MLTYAASQGWAHIFALAAIEEVCAFVYAS
jgi:hypothetical protein